MTYLSSDLSNDEGFDLFRSIGKCWNFPIDVKTDSAGISLAKLESKYLPCFPTPLFWSLGHTIPGGM
jgi:hypothetical protein